MTKQTQPPIEVLCAEVKQQFVTIINQAGLPPALIDSLLCSILADVRNEEMLVLLNYSKAIQAEAKETDGKKE